MEAQKAIIIINIYRKSGELITNVRLSQKEYARIREAAQKRGETLQAFFQTAVDGYIKRHNLTKLISSTSNHGKEP